MGSYEFIDANRTAISTMQEGERGKGMKDVAHLPPAARRPPKDGDGRRITSKDMNVTLDPLQCQSLVIIPGAKNMSVINSGTYFRQTLLDLPKILFTEGYLRRVRKAEHVESVISSNQNDILVGRKTGAVIPSK